MVHVGRKLIRKALPVIEDCFGSLKTIYGHSRLGAPATQEYHPGLDATKVLFQEDI